jgi:hypothetical protein
MSLSLPDRRRIGSRNWEGRRSRRHVVALDKFADSNAAFVGGQLGLLFDVLGTRRQLVVFDVRAKPAEVVALPQMVHPGFRIHSFSQLQEDMQVLGSEVEFVGRPAKIEATMYLSRGQKKTYCADFWSDGKHQRRSCFRSGHRHQRLGQDRRAFVPGRGTLLRLQGIRRSRTQEMLLRRAAAKG